MRRDPVVITGAGLLTALGQSDVETWKNLMLERSGIRRIERFDASGFECNVAAQVAEWDRSKHRASGRFERIGRLHSHMLLYAAGEAFTRSGLNRAALDGADVGLFVGMGMVDYQIEDLLPAVLASRQDNGEFSLREFYKAGYERIFPLWPLSMLNNISLCEVAIQLKIAGPNAVFSPDADSGAQAIGEAVAVLSEGQAKAVLAGGVSEEISLSSLARAHLQGVLNPEILADVLPCCPLGARRKGTVLGEGCGILTLELRSSAEARGARYSAAIAGYGAAFEVETDARAPTAAAIARAMDQALDNAELDAATIDLVLAHGDGTLVGDENEIEAISRVFEAKRNPIVVFSSKGALGHLQAAAPAADCVLTLSIFQHGEIPPAPYSAPPDPKIGFRLSLQALKMRPERVMVNCRSYEGQCSSLILERLK